MVLNYKLIIKIKQITPMIHFQADQSGATLRATELKPKLDRFILQLAEVSEDILKQCELENIIEFLHAVEKKDEGYFLKNDNPDINALKYKVRIKPEGESKKHSMPVRKPNKRTAGYGAFFPIDDLEKDSSFYDYVTVEFLSFNENLLNLIDTVFPVFLSTTSFGFRQNKGFGHFMTDCSKDEQIAYAKRYIRLFQSKYQLYKAENTCDLGYEGVLDLICKLNETVKNAMNYRKEKPPKRESENIEEKDKINKCCQERIGKSEQLLLQVLPEAKLYVENKQNRGIRKRKERVNSLSELNSLFSGKVIENEYKVTLDDNQNKVYTVKMVYHIFWKNELNDRGESPMYFIPICQDNTLQFKNVMILLDCDKLKDIQKELNVEVKAEMKTEGGKTRERKKSIPTHEYDGLLQMIFQKILSNKKVGNATIVEENVI